MYFDNKIFFLSDYFLGEPVISNSYYRVRGKMTDFSSGGAYCNVCNKHFSRIKSLRRHYQVIHAATPKIFKCSLCPRSYNRKDNLKQHENLCHWNDLNPSAEDA